MTSEVTVIGAATSRFGMFVDRSLRSLVADAVDGAVSDASVDVADVGLVVFGNAAAGLLTGQEMIRAQTALSESVLAGVPTLSVENACASSSTAFHVGCLAIESGQHDVVVVVGAEKMTHQDRSRASSALATGIDVEASGVADDGTDRGPVFMEIYAAEAREYMARTGATAEDFAAVVVKSTGNGSLNPIAQTRTPMTVGEVLVARKIVAPLTRPMCSSIGDGAAALVLCRTEVARRRGQVGPRVRASVLTSGRADRDSQVVQRTADAAFERAGVSPADVDVAEIHDAAAPAELVIVEQLGLAASGEAVGALRAGAFGIGGSCAINPSGGLLARGHAIGATGAAQLVEIVQQLRGRSGDRQVSGANVGVAENAGGSLGTDPAACVVTILAV